MCKVYVRHNGIAHSIRSPSRPKLEVSIEEIEYLRGLNFKWTGLLGISRSTLYRRLEEEGINPTRT